MAANQSASGSNRVLSSNFWWLRNANHVKFTEESAMCMEKRFNQKNIYKWAKHFGFVTELKKIHGVETYWLSSKGMVLGTVVSKEDHAVTVFWNMKGPIYIDFPKINWQLVWENSPYLLNEHHVIFSIYLSSNNSKMAIAVAAKYSMVADEVFSRLVLKISAKDSIYNVSIMLNWIFTLCMSGQLNQIIFIC